MLIAFCFLLPTLQTMSNRPCQKLIPHHLKPNSSRDLHENNKGSNELYDRYVYDSDKPYMILKQDCLFIFLKCALITRNPIFTRK